MSYAEDMGYDAYYSEDLEGNKPERFLVTDNGTKVCKNCGSKNIKTSKAGNEYCAELCWVKPEKETQ